MRDTSEMVHKMNQSELVWNVTYIHKESKDSTNEAETSHKGYAMVLGLLSGMMLLGLFLKTSRLNLTRCKHSSQRGSSRRNSSLVEALQRDMAHRLNVIAVLNTVISNDPDLLDDPEYGRDSPDQSPASSKRVTFSKDISVIQRSDDKASKDADFPKMITKKEKDGKEDLLSDCDEERQLAEEKSDEPKTPSSSAGSSTKALTPIPPPSSTIIVQSRN